MRKSLSMLLGLMLLVVAGGSGRLASAAPGQHGLARAKADRADALRLVRRLEARADDLSRRYGRAADRLERTAADVFAAYEERMVTSAQLAEAQGILNRQAATAYEAGPAFSLELLLGSRSSSDAASVEIYAARVIQADEEAVRRVTVLRGTMNRSVGALERRQTDLVAAVRTLEALATEVVEELTKAKDAAASAGLKVKDLEKRERALSKMRSASRATIDRLARAQRGLDQSDLLALLGPRKGRGCDLPHGLRDTGQRIAGIASWYGWDFAGRHTASGAIYDPRLFTAANKELPLNTFVRVHFNGRCAVVLVNDRGPYAPGRVIDLSEAAAQYLGVGLNQIVADVLTLG